MPAMNEHSMNTIELVATHRETGHARGVRIAADGQQAEAEQRSMADDPEDAEERRASQTTWMGISSGQRV